MKIKKGKGGKATVRNKMHGKSQRGAPNVFHRDMEVVNACIAKQPHEMDRVNGLKRSKLRWKPMLGAG